MSDVGRIDLFSPLFIAFVCFSSVVGGSSVSPVSAGSVRIAAVLVLFWALLRLGSHRLARKAAAPLLLLGGAVVLLIAQRVALPPEIWTNLPGRELAAQTYAAARIPLPALPISLAPWETWNALLGLFPPAAAFIATLTLDARQRELTALAFALMALASLLLGMLQLAGGSNFVLDFYDSGGVQAVGFFANRNHQALFLVSAVPLIAVIATTRADRRSAGMLRVWGAVALAVMLVVALAVTRSRAGVFLLMPAFVGALVIGFRAGQRRSEGRGWAPLAVMGASVPLGVLLVVLFNLTPIADRFKDGVIDDLRPEIAKNTFQAGLTYAPVGSGVGSFQAVYKSIETPETVRRVYINQAHNEYAQIWLEAGVPGVILAALFILWWAGRLMRLVRAPTSEETLLGVAGGVVIGLALLHSLVDYPLRTASIPVLFGFACALMIPTAKPRETD